MKWENDKRLYWWKFGSWLSSRCWSCGKLLSQKEKTAWNNWIESGDLKAPSDITICKKLDIDKLIFASHLKNSLHISFMKWKDRQIHQRQTFHYMVLLFFNHVILFNMIDEKRSKKEKKKKCFKSQNREEFETHRRLDLELLRCAYIWNDSVSHSEQWTWRGVTQSEHFLLCRAEYPIYTCCAKYRE